MFKKLFSQVNKLYLCFITSLLSFLVIASFSINLQAQVPTLTEAVLNLEFANPVSPEVLKSRLSSRFDDITIISASSKVDIDGQKQTFSLSNEKQVKTNEFLKTYQKSYKAFLSTLTILKDKTDQKPNQKEVVENQENLKPLLNKYSKNNLEKTKQKATKSNLNFDTLSISGSFQTLTNLKNSNFFGLAKTADLLDLIQLEKKSNEIKTKLDTLKTDQEKQDLINKTITESLGQNPQVASVPKLDLDQNKIQEIDKLVKKDIVGNNFINSADLKKFNLSSDQISQVNAAMTNYNQFPTELKDGSLQATQQVLQSTTFASELQKQDGLTDKIGAVLKGGVEVEAGCSFNSYFRTYWWGIRVYINDCMVNTIGFGATGVTSVANAVSSLCGPYLIACRVLIGLVTIYFATMKWLSGNCGYKGVFLDANWSVFLSPFPLPTIKKVC